MVKCIPLSEWDLMRHRGAFMDRVRVRGPDQCWTWTGAVCSTTKKRGVAAAFTIMLAGQRRQTTLRAHRAALYYFTGRLPQPDEDVSRTCGNDMCCNPAHFEVRKLEEVDDA